MPPHRTTSVAIGIILSTITLYFLLGPEYTPHLNTFWRPRAGGLVTNSTLDLTDAQLAAIYASDPTLSNASPYRQRLTLLDPACHCLRFRIRIRGFNITMPTPISPAAVSCWYSHYQVLRSIADGPDEAAIVFEDDIDMEFDLEKRLREMWRALPVDWDVVMLGHCQSHEWGHPKLKLTPALHRSTHTMCTHAYAVSKRGARKLVRFLRSEHFAYSRPVDHTFIHLGNHELIKIYSVLPTVVLQTKDNPSDIVAGTGGLKTEFLVDSVLERVQLLEKQVLDKESVRWDAGKDHLRV
ncbi:hypothetical protein RSAG8_11241, partial [Rhizoctonia solani AG-8 WAC10335]